jgi:very-short-patch-repair endonuclease
MEVEFVPPPVDRAIAAWARRQHGVVSARQLGELGLSQQAVSRRVAAGRLHRVHQGVFAVGHPLLGVRGHWMAAVLACGTAAALSHASAAALWGLQRGDGTFVDITASRTGRKRPGIRVHRPRTPAETTKRYGIPVTTAARTILDMAAIVGPSRLESLLNQAEVRELTDYSALDAMARAHPGHRGASRLRPTLATYYAGSDLDRSDLEILFAQLCRDHDLPSPRLNQHVHGKEVDFLFPEHQLIVEIDSWRYHKTRRAFEDDPARDVLTATAGHRTLRFTDRQRTRRPHEVVHAIATVLADRPGLPSAGGGTTVG